MTPREQNAPPELAWAELDGRWEFLFLQILEIEVNHLDFSSSFPLTLAQVFSTDNSTESESPS